MSVKVTCEVTVNDKPCKMLIHNAWNNNRCIEIEVGGERYKVCAVDLTNAIKNCTNVGI